MTVTSRIDRSIDKQRPSPPGSPPSVADYRWALERFTAVEWSVAEIEFETNDHLQSTDVVTLEATLSHQTGALIQCVPFDPRKHLHSEPVFSHHRIRTGERASGTNHYIAVTAPLDSTSPGSDFDALAGRTEHPYPDATKRVESVNQSDVHRIDTEILKSADEGERPAGVRGKRNAMLAILAAAQRIDSQSNTQRGLSEFA